MDACAEAGSGDQTQARIAFEAPCAVRWSRHDVNDRTRFIACFYAVPTGVPGRLLAVIPAKALV